MLDFVILSNAPVKQKFKVPYGSHILILVSASLTQSRSLNLRWTYLGGPL